jgi:hypothetical protein
MAMPPRRPVREFLRRLALWRGRRKIKAIVRPYCAHAGFITITALQFDPPRLALWIKTRTDSERDRLHADEGRLWPEFRRALVSSGYPAAGAESAWFCFESQETVDRDFSGSWHHRTK